MKTYCNPLDLPYRYQHMICSAGASMPIPT